MSATEFIDVNQRIWLADTPEQIAQFLRNGGFARPRLSRQKQHFNSVICCLHRL